MIEGSKMKDNEFRCAACNQIFEKGWTDEEARQEEAELFGQNNDDSMLVCDPCYRKMGYQNIKN